MNLAGSPYDVFFSYNWRDRAEVETVARALSQQRLNVFLDRWYLVPGRPWMQALEEVLGSCQAVAVFLGPQGMGFWQQREQYLALSRQARQPDFPVIPVLLPHADPALGFLSHNTLVDFRQQLDDPIPLEIFKKAVRGEPPGPDLAQRVQDTLASVCPYRGLRPFREEDAPFFFGRDEVIHRLTEAVAGQNLVAVVGASGCGKSSVARAGLVPHLRQDGRGQVWEAVTLLPGDRPLHSLAAALLPLLEPEMTEVERLAEVNKLAAYLQNGDLALRDVVARILSKQPGTDRLLLVADQWEELYTLTREDEPRRCFLDGLLETAQASPLSVALTLRGDFFGQALSYRPLADRLQDAVVTLGPMTRDELTQAIEQPAGKVGLAFEPGLVKRLLDDVGQEPGNLPLLEFALANLWELRQGGQLLHQVYDDMGRVQGAVARQAEEVFQHLTRLEQQAATRVFLELVQTGEATEDTRRRAGFGEMGEETRDLVKKLADARLVVTGREEATGQETVEVAHEALIQHWGRLKSWLDADREFLLWRQRLRYDREEWQHTGRDDGALLRGASLTEAESWLARRAENLTPGEKEFIQGGLDLRERERQGRLRQRRRQAMALTSGMMVALVLLALAGWQWWRAEGERRVSLARQLAAQASLTFSQQGQYINRSVLLAVESLKRWPTAEALQTLSRGLDLLPRRVSHTALPVAGMVKWSVLSPGGRYLACVGDDRVIQIIDVDRGRQVARLTSPEAKFDLAFSPDDRWLAMSLEKMVLVWEAGTGREALRLAPGGAVAAKVWDHSGARLVTAWFEPGPNTTTVRMVDVASNREVAGPLYPKPDPGSWGSTVDAMAITPDAKWLATGGLVQARVWDLAGGREVSRVRLQRLVKAPGGQQEYHIFDPPKALALSPDGRFLATSSLIRTYGHDLGGGQRPAHRPPAPSRFLRHSGL